MITKNFRIGKYPVKIVVDAPANIYRITSPFYTGEFEIFTDGATIIGTTRYDRKHDRNYVNKRIVTDAMLEKRLILHTISHVIRAGIRQYGIDLPTLEWRDYEDASQNTVRCIAIRFQSYSNNHIIRLYAEQWSTIGVAWRLSLDYKLSSSGLMLSMYKFGDSIARQKSSWNYACRDLIQQGGVPIAYMQVPTPDFVQQLKVTPRSQYRINGWTFPILKWSTDRLRRVAALYYYIEAHGKVIPNADFS